MINWLKQQRLDRVYWWVYIFLLVLAVLSIFSASSTLVYQRHSILGPVSKQMLFLAIGFIVAFVVQFVPLWITRMGGYAIWFVSVVCLYLIMNVDSKFAMDAHEASRWINLGGISFQPSEPAKLGLILVIADMLSRIRTEEDKTKYFYITLGVMAITVLPIFPHNLSTAILIAGITVVMWFLAHIPWKYVLSFIGICAILLIVGYFIVEFGYVRPGRDLPKPIKRAETWVSRVDRALAEMGQPAAEFKMTDDNYQSTLAKVAIARGGASPIGVGPGNSKERDFLPLAYMDYIFAIIVEEGGIVIAAFLILLYLVVLFRACFTSNRFNDYASMLTSMGLALMITCQALISMMVAVGLGPVTGQPLPLISMGGTSVIITSAYFGIMMSISREQKMLQEQQQQTAHESVEDVPIIHMDDTGLPY